MHIVKPSYEIISCPYGEECLAKLERIGRIAYKNEDRIDDGYGVCQECNGSGWMKLEDIHRGTRCTVCTGTGKTKERVRELSSYKFIRKILRTNRRDELKKKASKIARAYMPYEIAETDSHAIVDMVLDSVRDDPPHEPGECYWVLLVFEWEIPSFGKLLLNGNLMSEKIGFTLLIIAICAIICFVIYKAYSDSENANIKHNRCRCVCLPYQVQHCKKDTVVCYAPDGGVELIEIEEQN